MNLKFFFCVCVYYTLIKSLFFFLQRKHHTMRDRFHFVIQAFDYVDITTDEYEDDAEAELITPEEGIHSNYLIFKYSCTDHSNKR